MISFLSFSFLDLLSGLSNLEINIFHISYTIIFYSFLFHFNISCLDQPGIRPGGELPYEEYMGVCHELGSHFQEKIPKRVHQFFAKILERAIISVRNSK